jgi:carbonic anhydrase/SulP family sulfate permease
VLSCIDSRVCSESIFDTGLGDVFSVRIAGAITSRKVLGSLEYSCIAAGAKLILVIGHTRCGAVTAAVNDLFSADSPADATGCRHLDPIVREIQQSFDPIDRREFENLPPSERASLIDDVARRNVAHVVETIRRQSDALDELAREGRIAILGAMYDVASGTIEFLPAPAREPVGAADLA